jgi:hypothetical protein
MCRHTWLDVPPVTSHSQDVRIVWVRKILRRIEKRLLTTGEGTLGDEDVVGARQGEIGLGEIRPTENVQSAC